MGLIKSTVGAIGSTLHDQWKEAIRCEDMTNDILMVKKTTANGVISQGSTIIVAPAQCAIIYDNGKVIDATAEEGIYTWDSSSTPSFFAGQFGAVFKEMWQRFTYDGVTAKQQAVFFFNMKEIIDNKFGTPAPVMYKDWGHPVMNARLNRYDPMRVSIKCFGKYTFKIVNPAVFMNEIAGTADCYRKNQLVEQMRAEVIGSFSNVLNSLGSEAYKIEVLDLPNQTDEIKQIMDGNIFDEPIRKRGIALASFVIESLTLDNESQQKIDAYEIGGDQYQKEGVMSQSYAEAMKGAATNESGSMNGFMGMGMMNIATGAENAFGGVAQTNTTQPMQVSPEQFSKEGTKNWECPNCKIKVDGNFCSKCGTKKIEEGKKYCHACGNILKKEDKFCSECGTKLEE